jgi:hypothetical protein
MRVCKFMYYAMKGRLLYVFMFQRMCLFMHVCVSYPVMCAIYVA